MTKNKTGVDPKLKNKFAGQIYGTYEILGFRFE